MSVCLLVTKAGTCITPALCQVSESDAFFLLLLFCVSRVFGERGSAFHRELGLEAPREKKKTQPICAKIICVFLLFFSYVIHFFVCVDWASTDGGGVVAPLWVFVSWRGEGGDVMRVKWRG